MVNKKRQDLEAAENELLWSKLLKSYEDANVHAQKSSENLRKTMIERIQKKEYWREVQEKNSRKNEETELKKEREKRIKALKYDPFYARTVAPINKAFFPKEYEAQGYSCDLMSTEDSSTIYNEVLELDLTGRIWVAHAKTAEMTICVLCYFTSNTSFQLLLDPSMNVTSLRKFHLNITVQIGRWNLTSISQNSIEQHVMRMQTENEHYLLKKRQEEKMAEARATFERKCIVAKERRQKEIEADVERRIHILNEKQKKFQTNYKRVKRAERERIKSYSQARSQYQKLVQNSRREIEKEQKDYEESLRYYLKRKKERADAFVKAKRQMALRDVSTVDFHSADVVNAVACSDSLDLEELEHLGIRLDSIPTKDIELLQQQTKKIKRSKSAPTVMKKKKSASQALLGLKKLDGEGGTVKLVRTLGVCDAGKYNSQMVPEFPVNPSRKVVFSMQFV